MLTDQLCSDAFLPDTPLSTMNIEVGVQETGPETDSSLSDFSNDFAAGLLGGCAGLAFGHPFDTVKVRQQTATGTRLTMLRCIQTTFVKEGTRGFFKGMAFPLAAVGFQNSVFFGVYGNTIRMLTRDSDGCSVSPGYGSIFLAGGFAGAVQGFFACPIELVKIKMQSQTGSAPKAYRGPVHCIRSIYNDHGVRGCFRGLTATILREIPGLSVYITSYELLCNQLGSAEACSVPQLLFAGGVAGMLSWVVNIPIDIVKSRLQADDLAKPRYKSVVHCFVSSYRRDGWLVFWRGLPVTCIRAFPTNAVTFAVYSTSLQYLQRHRDVEGIL